MLRACLSSIQKFPPSEDHEVIVVDNASTDESGAMVRESFPEVTLIEPGANLGYAAGNNAAFESAKGDWLLTLNPDTEFIDDSLQRSIDSLKSKPEFGALGARLIDPPPSCKTQASVRGFPSLIGIFGDLIGLGRLFPRSALGSYRLIAFDYTKEGPAQQPMGTFLLFRREAVEAVAPDEPLRPFDESFPIFFNEVDLLRRMEDAGWKTLFTPAITILHHHGSSTKQVKKPMIWESHRSLMRYLHKHTKGVARFVLPLFALIVWAGALIRARGIYAGFRPDHHDL